MRRIFTSVAPTVITGIAGFLVLLSFVPWGDSFLIPGFAEMLIGLRAILINIAIIVTSIALLMGFVRLLNFHLRRFQQRRNIYSLIAVLTAGVVFVALIADRFVNFGASAFVFNTLIVPIQGSLGALMAIFLAAAAVRMARRRRTWGTVWFLVSAVIVLVTQIPPSTEAAGILQPIRDLFNALAMGGLRGLLLGVALGTMAVAFRVLFAIDRPQSE